MSDGKFSLGKNDEVNSLEAPSAPQAETPASKNHKTNSLETLAIKNHKTNSLETPAIKSTHNSKRTSDLEQTTISHEDEKVALVLSLTGIDGSFFDESQSSSRRPFLYGAPAEVH